MKQPWFVLCGALALGAFLAGRVLFPVVLLLFFGAWCAILRRKKRRYLIVAAAFLWSFVYAQFALSDATSPAREVALEGVVKNSKPYYYDIATSPIHTARVLSRKAPKPGDTVHITGIYEPAEGAKNPGGFDEIHYRTSRRIEIIRPRKERALSSKHLLGKLYGWREDFRRYGTETFRRYFSKSDAAMLASMLYGTETDGEEVRALYELNLIHILSISGLHIGLIVALLKKIATKATLPIAWARGIIYFLILIYLFLTGFPVGGMRVWCSLLFTDLGKRLRSPVDPRYALSFSGACFLIFNPMMIYRLGFLFSFLSVYGILEISPHLVSKKRRGSKIARSLALSASVTIMLLPLIGRISGKIALVGILANIFILPLAGLLLYGGIALSVFYPVFEPTAAALAIPMNGILALFSKGIALFSAYPNTLFLPNFTVPDGIAYYTAIALALYFPFYRLKRRAGRMLIAQGVGVFAIVALFGGRGEADLSITQLYVGQGDCAVVRGKDFTALIDTGGSLAGRDPAEFYVLPYLRHENITSLDAVFLSHYDADHMQGIFSIAETHPVRQIFAPQGEGEDDRAMHREIEKRVAPIQSGAGEIFFEKASIRIYPPLGASGNAASMIMRLESGGASALYLGDLPAKEEKRFAEYAKKATVLKLAHHGSKTSSSGEILEAIAPKLAIISAGEDNRYGHPHREVIERLDAFHIPYLQTEDGAIAMHFKDGIVGIEVYRNAMFSYETCLLFAIEGLGFFVAGKIFIRKMKERSELWNQCIIQEPILCTGRRNTVWSESALNSRRDTFDPMRGL